jgi:Holliday junction resolvase RusA-like endonuclease
VIIIPGEPIPQARMRHFTAGGITRLYDPNAKAKQNIRKHLLKNYKDIKCMRYPEICFLFYMPIPKNVPKKNIMLYTSGFLRHSKKPDVDNLIKLYLDCLTGMIIDDDNNVSLGFAIKLYHAEPKTVIYLREREAIFNPAEIILHLGEFLLPFAAGFSHLDKSCACYANYKR